MADNPPAPPVPPAPVPPLGPVAPALIYVIEDDVTLTRSLRFSKSFTGLALSLMYAVYEDSISSYDDLNGLTKDDINSMARGYANSLCMMEESICVFVALRR